MNTKTLEKWLTGGIMLMTAVLLILVLIMITSCQPEPPDAPIKRPERAPTTVEVPGDILNRC
jgi:hypothetical protein